MIAAAGGEVGKEFFRPDLDSTKGAGRRFAEVSTVGDFLVLRERSGDALYINLARADSVFVSSSRVSCEIVIGGKTHRFDSALAVHIVERSSQ